MLHNPPLLTIHRGHTRPSEALIEAFRGAQTSHVVDAMDGRGALEHTIKPVDPRTAAFVGPAVTAHAYPADVVGMFGAVHEAQPGDVIVCANDSYCATAVVGDLAVGMMRNKGVAGFVTDGLARDSRGIIEIGLPVFSRGISPNSPALNGPGTVGIPVTLGGVTVAPGDIIVADEGRGGGGAAKRSRACARTLSRGESGRGEGRASRQGRFDHEHRHAGDHRRGRDHR